MYLKHKITFIVFFALAIATKAQTTRPVYHPCFLMDSVEKRLDFIKLNAGKIFVDTFECKEALLDSIGALYLRSKDKKYLDALSLIAQNPAAKVEGLYIDVFKRFLDNNFAGFINQLYLSKGKYWSLEKELVDMMNMIVNGRPYKQRYMSQLNLEIDEAKEKKDSYKLYYLEKLKKKIEEDK